MTILFFLPSILLSGFMFLSRHAGVGAGEGSARRRSRTSCVSSVVCSLKGNGFTEIASELWLDRAFHGIAIGVGTQGLPPHFD
jgi:hypothetical protein